MGAALASPYSLLPPIASTPPSVHVPKRPKTELSEASADGLVASPSPPTIFRSDSLAAAGAVTSSPPIFSSYTRRRRREITGMDSSELWECSQPLCTKKYKKTSIQSIAEHRDKCAARPVVKLWEVEREQRRVSQLHLQQQLQNIQQQLQELHRQKEELQHHNAFLIQQAFTPSAASAAFFNPSPATAYHQHYHQYRSSVTNCSTNLSAWPPQPPPSYTVGPPPPPPTPSLQPAALIQPQPRPSYPTMAYAPESVLLSPHHMQPMQWGPARDQLAMYPLPTPVSAALSANATPEKG